MMKKQTKQDIANPEQQKEALLVVFLALAFRAGIINNSFNSCIAGGIIMKPSERIKQKYPGLFQGNFCGTNTRTAALI
jgi:hypothetical protein